MKVPTDGGDYTMDHSATLVVLDPQGRQAGMIRPPLVPADIAADLRLLSETSPMSPAVFIQYLLPHRLLSRLALCGWRASAIAAASRTG